MKITSLTIKDFLGIRLFKIDDCGKLNFVTGDNGVGKSSLLKAIKEAFKTTQGRDPNIINNDGKGKAEIFIELDGTIKIERKFTDKGNTVKVVKDGQPMTKPQTFLDSLIGPNVFNPVAFFMAKPDERRKLLMAAIDIKVSGKELIEKFPELPDMIDVNSFSFDGHGLEVIANIKEALYETRAEKKRDVTRITKSIEQEQKEIPETFEKAKFKDFDYATTFDEYEAAQKAIAAHEEKNNKLSFMTGRYNEIQVEIQSLEKKLEYLRTEAGKIRDDGKALRAEVDTFEAPDVEQMKATLDEYEKSRTLIVKLENIRTREKELDIVQGEHTILDDMHKTFVHDVPRMVMASAKLPIDGLELRDDDVYIDDKAFDKLSQSEQLRYGVEIARFLSADHELKVILVDGIEALSAKNRKAFIKTTQEDGYEYFITQVGDGELEVTKTDGKAA